MNSSDFFEKFDEHTLIKLKVWERYVTEWLPVFLKQNWIECINIVDLFSGPGKTKNNQEGSPLVALKTLTEKYTSESGHNNKLIKFYFNDIDNSYFNLLQTRLGELTLNESIKYEIFNLEFKNCYDHIKQYLIRPKVANLIFIDPFGSDPDDDFIIDVAKLPRTDFLLFVPSSYILRFGDPKIRESARVLNDKNASSITRAVGNSYKDKISKHIEKYYLWQFSLKEEGQYYGIIFGSAHPLGVEKFISISWKIDSLTGEANYDIDDDRIDTRNLVLFERYGQPKKVTDFYDDLEIFIRSKINVVTDSDIALFTIQRGMQAKHARDVYGNLVKVGAIVKRSGLSFDCKALYKNYTPKRLSD